MRCAKDVDARSVRVGSNAVFYAMLGHFCVAELREGTLGSAGPAISHGLGALAGCSTYANADVCAAVVPHADVRARRVHVGFALEWGGEYRPVRRASCRVLTGAINVRARG